MKIKFCWAIFIVLSSISGVSYASEIITPSLINRISLAESSNNPLAIGDKGRSRGLCQIQKATWNRYTSLSWNKAFHPELNKDIAELHLLWIAQKYGKRATPAKVIYTYNTGKFCKTLPRWTRKHPNKAYRTIFLKELNGSAVSKKQGFKKAKTPKKRGVRNGR